MRLKNKMRSKPWLSQTTIEDTVPGTREIIVRLYSDFSHDAVEIEMMLTRKKIKYYVETMEFIMQERMVKPPTLEIDGICITGKAIWRWMQSQSVQSDKDTFFIPYENIGIEGAFPDPIVLHHMNDQQFWHSETLLKNNHIEYGKYYNSPLLKLYKTNLLVQVGHSLFDFLGITRWINNLDAR